MKLNGNDLRPGNTILHNDKLWTVVKLQHVKPGKGGAFVQVELKGVPDGTKLNERFRSSESVEKVRLDQSDYQFIYREGDQFSFMDVKTYEQVVLGSSIIRPEQEPFLLDGVIVSIESYEGMSISMTLPDHATLEVSETDPVVKGQTAASSYKPAVLENGTRIQVPPFIIAGEKVVVNIERLEYLRRAEV